MLDNLKAGQAGFMVERPKGRPEVIRVIVWRKNVDECLEVRDIFEGTEAQAYSFLAGHWAATPAIMNYGPFYGKSMADRLALALEVSH